jgi:hypothetical protein
MKLNDALFNWLQIRVVADARPHDRSAADTADFFLDILVNDHQIAELTYEKDEISYTLQCRVNGEPKMQRYDRETVDALLVAIENEPKYNE